MKRKSPAPRFVATALSLALIHSAFGPAAWAQLVPQVGAIAAPVGGVSAAAGSASALRAGAPAALSIPSGSLTASPLAAPSAFLSAPSAAASLPLFSAASAAAPAALPALAAPAAAAAPARPAAALSASAAAAAPETGDAAGTKPSIQAPAAAPAPGSSALETAPEISGVRARVSRRLAELKNFFGAKKAEAVPSGSAESNAAPSGLTPAAKSSSAAADKTAPAVPPAPEAPAGETANQKAIRWFLGGLVVTTIGSEILGLAMPLLMRSKFGGFSALAHLAVVSSGAGIVGRLSGGWIAGKLGVKTTYIGATLLRLASITTMVVFLMGPTAPLVAAVHPLAALATFLGHYSAQAVLIVFYSINGLMAGISLTTEKSIPAILLGNNRATMERYGSLQQWLQEIAGVSGPKAGGALVQAFGFTTAIAVYPVMLATAVAMYMFGLRLPAQDGGGNEIVADKPASAFSRIMAPLAPVHRAIGAFFKTFSDKVKAIVDRLVLKVYLGRWIEKLGGKGNLTDADEQALLSRSTLGWTAAAMASLAGFLTLLLPVTYPAYAAMIVFGVAEVIATQKLYSLLLSRTKGRQETLKVNAVVGALMAAASTLSLNLAGGLFDHFAGRTPFLIFSAALIPLAAGIFLVRRALKKADARGDAGPAARPTSGFGLLFKDPVMRWSFAGYVLLAITNPLLYQILSQAFGLIIVGGAAAAASGVASWITALYSLGGLLGALYMWRESTLISDAKKKTDAPAPK